MKHLLLTIPCLLIFITGFTLSSEKNPTPGNHDKILVYFTNNMEFNDLVKIKLNMADHGITLQYQKLEFDENGKLQGLAIKVDCHDGFSGSASKFPLTDGEKVRFFRDYDPDANSPFGIGTT